MDKSPEPDEVLRSSKGRNNFQSLALLLISGGTALLREVFDIKCPPSNLPTTLQNPATKKLLEAPPLSKSQRDCLYPSPGMYGKSTDFEMTLLFRLLRTICGFAPPATGWDCLPSSTDHSFGADLARIKYYRNSLYGHVNENMEIADDEFSSLRREISEALVRIAGQISPAKAREWKNVIDTYKDEFGGKIESIAQEVQRLRQELRDEAQDIKDRLKVAGQTNSSAGVTIRIRIDCETIPDPYPGHEKLETVVVAMQGTQACGDELVVTGAPEGTPKGTQDTQAESHEMVVTEVKRRAVEPDASAGLPLAGRTESVEEARRNNFQRLARLLISGGTLLLREVFDIKCPPSNLPTTLQNPATKKLLEAAKLSKSQRDCLYPSSGTYGKSTDFDMTLLFRLLRTICGFAPPATGWDCLPSSTDHSFGADLARINYYRNLIYGHVNENMEIADGEFSSLWREISEALERIAGHISPAKAKEWQNAIDTFLKDPLTEEDKRHEQELQRWYQNDREVKKYLEKAESSMKHLEKEAQYLRQVVREEAKDIKDEPGAKEESIAEEVQRLTHDIKDKLEGKVESTAQEVQRLRQEFRDEGQDIKDRLNAAGQTNSSAGVRIRMQIDCGSIPDPHPHTQACDDELVITGTSEGMPEGTQDTQAGSQEMVVTEVKCEAVDPVSSASLPLAGRREEEKAGVGSNDVVPNTQSVLNFIAHKYFQTIDTTKLEELNGFLQYLSDVRKVLVLDAQRGSLILTALCSSLEILDSLWYDYCAGHLSNLVQKHLLTKDVLKKFDSTEMKLAITIEREEYINARKFFLQGSEFQTGVALASDEDKDKTNNIVAMAMEFEAKHRECVRVLTYTYDGHVKVKLYVLSGKTGIPEALKAAAQDYFKEMNVKLEWLDLYRDADEILKIRPLEYPSGKRKALNDSQVDDISKVISENLHVLVRHRNITAVQPSLKIKDSKQTETPCITLYVLSKGVIPDGEGPFPLKLGSYLVDVVDGMWFRTDDPWLPNEAQEQSEVLCLGASIGVQGEDAAGTLGAIVKGGETFYALSCDHVMRHSTELKIIHPAQNDHLNYLNYHLQQYGMRIKHIIDKESCHIQANQFSFGHIAGLEELSNKFQELRGIKETHLHHAGATKRKLEAVKLHEEAFERGLTPPRVIAKYSVGISGNVTWNDGQQYYVDASLAELTPEEVDSLRQSQTAEMIETGDHLSGEFSSIRKARGELCKSGRTTGFTRSGCHVEPSIFLRANFGRVNDQNDSLFSIRKNVRLCQSCGERSGIGAQLESTAAPCDSCEIDTPTLRDSLWFKNCLCIDNESHVGEAKVFATEGDSGAVLFERNNDGNLQAFGIIFAELRCSYKLMTLATPVQIALERLSRKISENTNLTLLSNYE